MSALQRQIIDAPRTRPELSGRSGERAAVDTIYFGGGTPSLLEPADVDHVISACRHALDVRPGAEVTLEANPKFVTAERLAAFKAAGVNRLSLGVQSFHDDELARLGRRHDAGCAAAAFALARAVGFDNVSLDLMLGLPGQTVAARPTLSGASSTWVPSTLQCIYSTSTRTHRWASRWCNQGGPWGRMMRRLTCTSRRWTCSGRPDMSSTDLQCGEDRLSVAPQPEVLDRWGMAGLRLRSALDARSRALAECLATREYIALVAAGADVVAQRRTLAPTDRVEETMFMGLRLSEGIALSSVQQRYAIDVWQRYGDGLTPYLEAGLLVHERGRLRLTRRGMLWPTR